MNRKCSGLVMLAFLIILGFALVRAVSPFSDIFNESRSSCDLKHKCILYEGQSVEVIFGQRVYNVSIDYLNPDRSTRLNINGDITALLKIGSYQAVSGGKYLHILNISSSERATESGSVKFKIVRHIR